MAQGFAHLSVGAIAAALKCSRRTLYEIAPTKEELLVTVVRREYNRRLAATKAVVYEHSDAMQRILQFLKTVRRSNALNTRQYIIDIKEVACTNRERLIHVRIMMEMLESLLQECKSQGYLRDLDPRMASFIAFSLLNAVYDPQASEQLDRSYHDLFHDTIDVFFNGIFREQVDAALVTPEEP